ncbi:MAG: TonB-dependent receptor [Bacteroidales bacterium]|nr:TonB-dependent receptor [Bacteroidales bacterium]
MKKIKFFLSLVLLTVATLVSAQTINVSGTVRESNGEAVSGAAVQLKGSTTVYTMTDALGNFSISVPANGTLAVSCLGYDSVEVPVNGRRTIEITLDQDLELLDEVTVVAYGTKRKQDLVGSVSTVKSNILQNTQATSVTQALEGAVAGLQVITSSGQPGQDANMYVRGVGSLSASNSALIVLDGVPYTGALSNINPNDIESITVSKDAVSNSLYGARAAGGVIMVTTKSGARDKANVRFSANAGVLNRAYKDYSMATDPAEFYRLTWYGIRNTQYKAGYSLEDAAVYASENLLGELGDYNAFIIPAGEYLVGTDGKLNPAAKVRYNDSFADNMFQTATRQEYNLSASGTTGKTDYYLSMGYLDNQSYIVGSNYNRLSARVNVSTQLKSWLRVGMNLGYSKTNTNGVQESTTAASNPFSVARGWAPIYPVHAYDANGNMIMKNGQPVWDAGTGQTAGTVSRPVATNQNVICNLYEDIRQSVVHAVTTRSFVEFRFLKDFTFTANYSYDFRNATGVTYYTPTIGDGASFKGRGTHSANTYMTQTTQQILAYEKIFGDNHSVSAKIGHEYENRVQKSFSGQKTNFYDPYNPELSNGGPMQEMTSSTDTQNIEGFFAMADYNYASRYYLSAAFRRDGTSRFINRWGNFWAVGAAYRISAEPWMADTKGWLDDLKLRASYGTQGNQGTTNWYPCYDQYAISWDGAALGYSYSYYGNPDLSWEKQKTLDFGLDFGFLNRIRGTVDYFIRRTDDMLFQRPLAFSTGGRPYNWENIGAMENRGIEFDFSFDILKNKDITWTVSILGSHYANKILTLPEENREEGIVSSTFKLMENRDRYEYYTWMYAGMDDEGNAMWYMDEVDENGDKTGNKTTTTDYNDAQKYYLGKTALPKVTGGLNSTLTWKGIDFTVQTSYQIGGWAYDSEYLDGMSNSFYVGHSTDLWDTWNPETKTGKYPVWNANNNSNSYTQTSDAHLIDASYFSIKNLTIGYSFPQKWMNKLGVQGIRIFCTADNLALFSRRQGFDPRVSFTGATGSFSGYAPIRTISGGLTFTF